MALGAGRPHTWQDGALSDLREVHALSAPPVRGDNQNGSMVGTESEGLHDPKPVL